jgi:hypothetical protein
MCVCCRRSSAFQPRNNGSDGRLFYGAVVLRHVAVYHSSLRHLYTQALDLYLKHLSTVKRKLSFSRKLGNLHYMATRDNLSSLRHLYTQALDRFLKHLSTIKRKLSFSRKLRNLHFVVTMVHTPSSQQKL